MDYTIQDDEALLRLISTGRNEALSVLYDRYGRLVFSVAFKIVGDRAAAEEITFDIFTRVWKRADTYHSDRGKVRVWLTGMARNRAIDILRQRAARPEQHSIKWDDMFAAPAAASQDPETKVVLALQKQQVRAAVAELPAEQKEVLALAYFEGHSQSQIAKKLSQPLGTVKSRLRLAMEKLRQKLQKELIVT